MNTTTHTAAVGVLTASALYVGAWAALARHRAYQDHHLGEMNTFDAVGNVVTLGGTLVLALLLLVPVRKETDR